MEIKLTSDLQAHIAELAASTGRSPDEIMQEAVALWEERENARVLAEFRATLDEREGLNCPWRGHRNHPRIHARAGRQREAARS